MRLVLNIVVMMSYTLLTTWWRRDGRPLEALEGCEIRL